MMNDVRRRILDASVALVQEQGVRAVSFREVARRAGVSHQTPYHHFGHHEGILRAIAEDGFATMQERMEQAVAAAGENVQDRLSASGVAYVAFALDHPGHFRVMFQRHLAGAMNDERCTSPGMLVPEYLLSLSEAAHRAGYGAPMDAHTLALLCWSTVHGLATLLTEGALPMTLTGDSAALTNRVVRSLDMLLRRPEP